VVDIWKAILGTSNNGESYNSGMKYDMGVTDYVQEYGEMMLLAMLFLGKRCSPPTPFQLLTL
jgi:hypothetical protein